MKQKNPTSFRSDLLNENQLFLKGRELLKVAFKLNTIWSPHLFQDAGDSLEISEGTQSRHKKHQKEVFVQLLDPRSKAAVSILELNLITRPAIIDQTLRFHGAEGEHIKHTIDVDTMLLDNASNKGKTTFDRLKQQLSHL